jgi:hypothetical protein
VLVTVRVIVQGSAKATFLSGAIAAFQPGTDSMPCGSPWWRSVTRIAGSTRWWAEATVESSRKVVGEHLSAPGEEQQSLKRVRRESLQVQKGGCRNGYEQQPGGHRESK